MYTTELRNSTPVQDCLVRCRKRWASFVKLIGKGRVTEPRLLCYSPYMLNSFLDSHDKRTMSSWYEVVREPRNQPQAQ